MTHLMQSAKTAAAGKTPIIVRTPAKSEECMKWVLDAVCNTAQQAQQIAKFARYGCHYTGDERSFGPRDALFGSLNRKLTVLDYVDSVNI